MSDVDLAQVDGLLENLRKWFEEGHESAHYNTVVPPNSDYPSRVWDEFVHRLRSAGWPVDARGAMVVVEKPRRR